MPSQCFDEKVKRNNKPQCFDQKVNIFCLKRFNKKGTCHFSPQIAHEGARPRL